MRNKHFLIVGLLLIITPVLALAAPSASIEFYDISTLYISPNNVTSPGIFDETNIDIKFTSEVTSVSMDMIDSLGAPVKHLYDAINVTNPNSKVWDGKDEVASYVADGIYTVQIVYADAGGIATDTSKMITVDNASPVVGSILLTPAIPIDPTSAYIGSHTTISASTTDSNINPASCRYSISGGSSPAVTVPTAYDATTNSCIFSDIDTTAAVGIAVSVEDLAGNAFDTTSSWLSVTPDLVAPVITVLGSPVLNLEIGTTYTDEGATASDSVEGDLSSSIIKAGAVDPTKVGAYTLTYNVTDSLGNVATEATRTVKVNPTTPSGSHTSGYVLGWQSNNLNLNPVAITGQVLGTSTEKTAELSSTEEARLLKKKLNQIRIEINHLKHSHFASVSQKSSWKFW